MLQKSSLSWDKLKRLDPLVLPAFFVGLPMAWFSYAVALCILWSLFKKDKLFSDKPGLLFYLFVGLYALYFVGIWNSSDSLTWMYKIRGKVFYLLIPLLFTRQNINIIAVKKAWISGLVFTMVLLLFGGLLRSFAAANLAELYYGKLSLYGHPSYLGLIAVVGLLFSFDLKMKQYKRLGLIALIALYIYLLSARSIFLAAVPVMMVLIVSLLRKPKKLKTLALGLFIGALSAYAINSLSITNVNRSKEAIAVLKAPSSGGQSSTAVRIDMWSSVWKHRQEFLPLGAGAGNVEPLLEKQWADDGLHYLLEKGYSNVHNQYLQHYVALGIPGVLLLFVILLHSLKGFRLRDNWMPLAYFSVVSIALLFECILERQMGIGAVCMLICMLQYPTIKE